jgi:voltage-gated potassium channel
MTKNLHKKFLIAILIFLIFLVGGTFIYSHVENWSRLDSLYFTVITVTTIGYGDLFPLTNTGKVFTMLFSIFGVGMAFYFFTLFGKYIYKKTFEDEFKKHNRKLMEHIESKVKKEVKSKKKK